jgi:hypothetical protein
MNIILWELCSLLEIYQCLKKKPNAYIIKVVPGIQSRHKETLLQNILVEMMGETFFNMAEISLVTI